MKISVGCLVVGVLGAVVGSMGCSPVSDASAGETGETGSGSDSGPGPGDGSPTTTTTPSETGASPTDGTDGTDGPGVSDSTGETGTEGGGTTDTGEPPSTCVGSRRCVSAVPPNWEGPVALRENPVTDDVLPCAGDSYDYLDFANGLSELVAPDYDCGCVCNAGGVGCTGNTQIDVNLQQQENLSPCGQPPPFEYSQNIVSDAPQATSLSVVYGFGTIASMATAEVEGSCSAVPSETPSEAAFTTRTIACGTFDATDECGDDALCVPIPAVPYPNNICIWQDGDVECPAGTDYTDRRLLHQNFEDTRDCSTCSCGAPQGSCQNGSVTFDGLCNASAPGVVCVLGVGCVCPESPTFAIDEIDSCQVVDVLDFYQPCPVGQVCLAWPTDGTTINSITYDAGTAQATCQPAGGQPVGEATPVDPITVCCTP